MTTRIEIGSKVFDTRAAVRAKKFQNLGYKQLTGLQIFDVYTIDKSFTQKQLDEIASRLANPLTQNAVFRTQKTKISPSNKFSFAVEIGFLPGVTDNVAHTTKEIIEDGLKVEFADTESVYTSQVTFLEGKLTEDDAKQITLTLYNPLIQRAHIKSYTEFVKDGGMDVIVPQVKLSSAISVSAKSGLT